MHEQEAPIHVAPVPNDVQWVQIEFPEINHNPGDRKEEEGLKSNHVWICIARRDVIVCEEWQRF